jgi:TonB-dependent SusC/RagA subfamily outer membrane receptor
MKHIFSIFIVVLLVIVKGLVLQAQNKPATVLRVTIQSLITNEKGDPVEGALVSSSDGAMRVMTTSDGTFSFESGLNAILTIEARGYKTKVLPLSGNLPPESIVMDALNSSYDFQKSVEMPYASFNNRQVTGAVSSYNIEELEQFDNQKVLFQLLQGRIPGTFGLSNVRGLGNALVVVDGVPRNNVSDYNIQEVESVTILRDAASRILYGAQANNGVIVVKTKRGIANRNLVRVTADYGLANPLAMPDYLDSYNFAKLYNEARLNDNKPLAFSEEELNGFANNSGSLRYPNENYYSSAYIKPLRPESSIVSEFSGGN